ncbi:Arabidopsis Toxicos en Levadura 29 [Hibiscus trionum]|uniref:RING-type E3 ubiquitin transferase n=1 Tax=Hibiscus trionum TaxID=183268 RepID=A0A9W7JM99_HIBTR|nr:Arabidopsis Toxicos en Levadura 29 [Hibiscus trionum]
MLQTHIDNVALLFSSLYTTKKQKKSITLSLIDAKTLGRNHLHSGHRHSVYSMPMFTSHAEAPSSSNTTPPLAIIISVVLLVLFAFAFLTVCFCRCILQSLVRMWSRRQNPSGAVDAAAGADMNNGLDPELREAFPTFYYSTVKEFRREKYGLECAICLGEFNDDDMLRLLTICCHVFHKECVDLWLESHKTCPFCRGELDEPRQSLDKSPLIVRCNSMHEIGTIQSPLQDAVCIDIREDNDDDTVGGGEDEAPTSSNTRQRHHRIPKFSRSNSTGHSISRTREECRYTLRLPEHIKAKIVRGHKIARSCIAFGDFASPSEYRNQRFRETSETHQGDDKV